MTRSTSSRQPILYRNGSGAAEADLRRVAVWVELVARTAVRTSPGARGRIPAG